MERRADVSRQAGQRFRRYLLDRLAEMGQSGGISGLERVTGVDRRQMHQWFNGSIEPRLESFASLSRGLGVSRATLVAALDGQLPPPNWQAEVAAEVQRGIRTVLEEQGLELRRVQPQVRRPPGRKRKTA